MFIEAEFAFNEGGNDGYWRFQLRSTKTGRWVKMGGLAYFEYRVPGDKTVYRAYGTFQGNIRRGWSIIRVGEGESLPPGDYEIDSRFIEPVKAMLKADTPTSKTDVVDAPKKIDEAVAEEAAGKQVVASTVGDLEVGDIVQQKTESGLYGRIASVDHSGATTKLNVEWSDGTAFDMDLPKDQKIRVWNSQNADVPTTNGGLDWANNDEWYQQALDEYDENRAVMNGDSNAPTNFVPGDNLYSEFEGSTVTTVPSSDPNKKFDVEATKKDGLQIVDFKQRKVVMANINGVQVPFYLSTGAGGKKDVQAGKWYPFFGIEEGTQWINKASGDYINDYYGSPELRAQAEWLDANIGDIRDDNTVPIVRADDVTAFLDKVNVDTHQVRLDKDGLGNDKLDTLIKANIADIVNRVRMDPDALQKKADEARARVEAVKKQMETVDAPEVDYAAEKWGKNVALVSLDKLSEYMHVDRTDPGQQVPGYSDANIDALAREMQEKGVYGLNQPLVLEWDPNGGWAYLVEGNHRLAAAKKAGLTELPVVVYQGMELSHFRNQGIGAPLTLTDSPEFNPDKANPSRFEQLKNSVVNKKPEIGDAPKSEVKDQNLKPEMDGEDALSIIRDAAAEVAVEDGRFPVARSAEDVEAGAKKQYAGVYEALRTESPYLVGQFLNFDEFWQYAKKYLAAGVSTRYADSVNDIPPLMKAANRIYARDVLGLDPDGEITFYRNAINNHADVARAAAGYASLDKNMAFNYNSDKENNGANGRYSVKAKPDEILGLLGYSDAVDEHGVVIGPDVTAIPGRVERLGDLGWTPVNELMDPELTNTGPGGGSKFRFFSTASTFEFPVLDANPFAAGENDKWSDFYAANGLEQGAIPGKYDELYGEGAFERDFPNSSGVPRYDIARDLFTEKDGQFALDPIKFDETFKGSNTDLQGRAGDDRDKALKFFEAVQGLSGQRIMVPRGSNKNEEASAVLEEIQSEVVDAPNVEEAKPSDINTSGESVVKDFNGKEIKPGDTAQIRTDNDIFDVVFTGYDLDSLRGVTGDPSPHIAVYVPEGNSGKWKPGYYMVKAKDLNFVDYSTNFDPEEHADELSDKAFRLNKLKDPSEFTQVSIEQARSLGIYQGSAYSSIAKFLVQTQGMDLSGVEKLDTVSGHPMTRGVGKKGEPLELTDDVMSFFTTLVSNIDEALNNSPVFPDGTLLYRGLDASRNKEFPIEGILDGSITEFSSAGYSSTSSKQDVADGFAMGETPVLMKITPSSDLTGYRYQRESGNPFAEEETLLGRNVVYSVTSVEYEDRYMSAWDENNNQIVKSVPIINVEVRPAETVDAPNVIGWDSLGGPTEGKGESELLDALVDGDFLDVDSIEDGNIDRNFDLDDLVEEQAKSVRYYKGAGFRAMNNFLRYGQEDMSDDQLALLQTEMSNLDELIDTYGDVSAETTVFRGMFDQAKITETDASLVEFLESAQPGDIYSDPGYTATTTSRAIAIREFGLGQGTFEDKAVDASQEQWRSTALFAIKIPEGSKALGLPIETNYGREAEVVLPRDAKLKINAIRRVPQVDADGEENGNYNYFVDAEVVPQVAEAETVDSPNVVEEAPAVEPMSQGQQDELYSLFGAEGLGLPEELQSRLTKAVSAFKRKGTGQKLLNKEEADELLTEIEGYRYRVPEEGSVTVTDHKGNPVAPNGMVTIYLNNDTEVDSTPITVYGMYTGHSQGSIISGDTSDAKKSDTVIVFIDDIPEAGITHGYYALRGGDLNTDEATTDFGEFGDYSPELDSVASFKNLKVFQPKDFTRMTGPQQRASKIYQGIGYMSVRHFVTNMDSVDLSIGTEIDDNDFGSRQFDVSTSYDLDNPETVGMLSKIVSELDTAIANSPGFRPGTRIYRGIDNNRDGSPWLDLEAIKRGEITQIADPSFQSTSGDKKIAKGFAKGSSPLLFEISPSEELSGLRLFEMIDGVTENEILLPRNVVYEIVELTTEKSTKWQGGQNVEVEIPLLRLKARFGTPEELDSSGIVKVSSEAEEAAPEKPKRLTALDGGVEQFWADTDGTEYKASELKIDVAKALALRMRELGVTDEQLDEFNRYVSLKNTASGPPSYLDWDGVVGVGQIQVWGTQRAEFVSLPALVRGYLSIKRSTESADDYMKRMSSSGDFDFTMEDVRRVLEEVNSLKEVSNPYIMYSDLSAELRSELATSTMVSDWAGSSNDAHPRSLTVQNLAEEVFGIENASEWDSKVPPKTLAQIDEYTEKFGDVYRAYIKAQYELTQQKFKDAGITEVVLYRGMNEVGYEDVKGLDQREVRSTEIQSRPLSSWSTNIDTAYEFGVGQDSGYTDDKFLWAMENDEDMGYPLLMRQVVPVEAIFATPFTGVGCYKEEEMVVLGGEARADAVIAAGDNQMRRLMKDFEEKEAKRAETIENPGPGGIIGRDDLGNPIYKESPQE